MRMLISRDGFNLSYVPGARNARSPFVSLGLNKCGPHASMPSTKNGWCNPNDGIEQHTSTDTSAIYMASGYIRSKDDSEIYLYASAQPFSHGGDAGKHLWGDNTGIRVVRLRKHGFAFVRAPYTFKDPAPRFTTVSLKVPSDCPDPVRNSSTVTETSCSYEFPGDKCPSDFPVQQCVRSSVDCVSSKGEALTCGGEVVECDLQSMTCKSSKGELCERTKTVTHISGGVQLIVNTETSVVGSVSVSILDESGASVPGFSNPDPIKGNTVNAVASWNDGLIESLSDLAGKTIRLEVSMRDAKLYSLELGCAA